MMRKAKTFLCLVMLVAIPVSGQVTMGAAKSPEKFSVLELISNNTHGLRLPQLTVDQRNAISDKYGSKPEMMGLTIFNTENKCVEVWNGTVWISKCAPPTNVCFDTSTKGTDFWISFGYNLNRINDIVAQVLLALKISAEEATDVTLNFTSVNQSTTYNIGDNSLTTIDLKDVQGLGDMFDAVYLNDLTGVQNKTLHITSSKPISVYAFSTSSATTDATIVLPVADWGKEYYKLSYQPANSYSDYEIIISNESGTVITPPSGPTIALDAGQEYVYASVSDLTGRHVTSNKPIAYFSHSMQLNVPNARNFADILLEQMMPVNRWGKQFLVPNAPEGTNNMNNHIRIIASEDGTMVNYWGATSFDVTNGQTGFTSGSMLNAGQWVELEISGANTAACYISADKPIGVAAYMVGCGIPFVLGDPSIAWIPPLNQSILSSIISPFMFPIGVPNDNTNFDGLNINTTVIHYMIIITKTDRKEQTSVNGAAISSAGWIDNQESGYSYYYWYFDNTADLDNIFNVKNPDNGVIVLCGGVAEAESYYYNAGSGACIINW